MAEDQDQNQDTAPVASRLDRAAEIVGSTLGSAARAVDSFTARHPDPIGEVSDAIQKGRAEAARLTAEVKRRSKAGMKKAKAASAKVRATAARARRKGVKALASARRSSKKGATRTKAAAKRARKTAPRARRTKR